MEAFTLGRFRGSIWIGLGETSGSAVFYLDRPSIWKGGADLKQGLLLDDPGSGVPSGSGWEKHLDPRYSI